MSNVNLFILIPESNPFFNWINSNNNLIDEEKIYTYLSNLKSLKDEIKCEEYVGFYDGEIFMDLLNSFDILEEYFPNPPQRRLKSLFSSFYNWRENQIHSNGNIYTIYALPVQNHSLCEVAQRKNNSPDAKFALLNSQALTNKTELEITINETNPKLIEVLNTENDLFIWFSNNRIPKRNFHSIPKHNIKEPIIRNGKLISPFYGTSENADEILKTAIGNSAKELFGYDPNYNMVIIFKYENKTPQNQYHGYHVAIDSDEIPPEIGIKIQHLFK